MITLNLETRNKGLKEDITKIEQKKEFIILNTNIFKIFQTTLEEERKECLKIQSNEDLSNKNKAQVKAKEKKNKILMKMKEKQQKVLERYS